VGEPEARDEGDCPSEGDKDGVITIDGEGGQVDGGVRVGDRDGFTVRIFKGGTGLRVGLPVVIAVGAQVCAFTVPRESIRDWKLP
jgi:hypothetical protein